MFNQFYYLSMFLLLFVAVGVSVRFMMLLLSVIWIFYEKKLIMSDSKSFPKISILIPAYNEEASIVESVTHLINMDYPDFEVIVINDGSVDNTLSELINAFQMSKNPNQFVRDILPTQFVKDVYYCSEIDNLVVIDKENGGKADALNCGINASDADYVLALDADTVLTKNTLKYLINPMLLDDIAVVCSGSVRILTENRFSLLNNLQKIEFVNSISLFRTGWNFMNANLIISGALGLFKKKIMTDVGGYHNLAIGEDMEVIVRIHRQLSDKKVPYRILQLALPTCFTKPVPSIKDMIKQRKRWQKGLLSSLRLNVSLFLNPRYKTIGMLALPFYVFFEVLGPFIEVIGLVFYGVIAATSEAPATPILIWCAGLIFAVFNNWLSISIDKLLLRGMSWKEYFQLLLISSTEPFFYHFIQLYCKIKGTIEYFSTIQTSTVWSTRQK